MMALTRNYATQRHIHPPIQHTNPPNVTELCKTVSDKAPAPTRPSADAVVRLLGGRIAHRAGPTQQKRFTACRRINGRRKEKVHRRMKRLWT